MSHYGPYENKIQSGDLLAWSGKEGFYANLIRIMTESDYIHVAIAYRDENDELYVIEAEPPRVRKYPLIKKGSFYHIPMGMEFTSSMKTYLFSKIGQPYSYWDAFVSYFTKPTEDKHWQCAELAIDFYGAFGIDLGQRYTPEAVVKAAMMRPKTYMSYVQI